MQTAWIWIRCWVTLRLTQIQAVWCSDNIFTNFERHWRTLKLKQMRNLAEDCLLGRLRVKRHSYGVKNQWRRGEDTICYGGYDFGYNIRAPDNMFKMGFYSQCLRYFFTKSCFLPLLRIVSMRRLTRSQLRIWWRNRHFRNELMLLIWNPEYGL